MAAELVALPTTILFASFGIIVAIFIIAFYQGREISFWPPKIGPKPAHIDSVDDPAPASTAVMLRDVFLQERSAVTAASGKTYIYLPLYLHVKTGQC